MLVSPMLDVRMTIDVSTILLYELQLIQCNLNCEMEPFNVLPNVGLPITSSIIFFLKILNQ